MDAQQRKMIKKCYNEVNALLAERKELNAQVRETFKHTSQESGWDLKTLKDGFGLYKKGVTLEDITELYEVFSEMDSYSEDED